MARPRPKTPRRNGRPRPKSRPSNGQPGKLSSSNGEQRALVPLDPHPKLHHLSKYDPEFPTLLIKHMERGLSFETFGATAGLRVTRKTLYNWLQAHPEFQEAYEIGRRISQEWWERLGIAIAVDDPKYQLEILGVEPFLKKRTTRMIQGGPVMDVIEEYHVPRGNTGAWIFNMKNRFGWRDLTDITSGGEPLRGGGDAADPKDLKGYSDEVLRLKHHELMLREKRRILMAEEDARRNEEPTVVNP